MTAPSVTLAVWVQPGASRERIVGRMGDALKLAVTAPPEKGKANQAVEKLLARELGVPRSAVIVTAGTSNRRKTVRIEGIAPERLGAWLQQKLQE